MSRSILSGEETGGKCKEIFNREIGEILENGGELFPVLSFEAELGSLIPQALALPANLAKGLLRHPACPH